MAIDALRTAVSQLSTDVQTLIAQGAASVPQADVDAMTNAVNVIDSAVKAALPAPPTPPAA